MNSVAIPIEHMDEHAKPDSQQKSKEKATYMILAPAKACAGLPYAISVNILEQETEPIDVEVKLTGADTKMEATLKGLTFGKTAVAHLGIIPTDLMGSENSLMIKGIAKRSGIVLFEHSHPLELRTDSFSVFIQTDKAMYKPGDLVQFRTIVVKSDLTPFTGFANIQIKDAKNVVIKKFKSLSLDMGVATGELQLCDEPSFGDWSIVVNVESENRKMLPGTGTKTFELAKYVLPKFDIKLDYPSETVPGKDIHVTVRSKYTYGKGVRGTAKVVMGSRIPDWGEKVEQTAALDETGTADFVFKYVDLEKKKVTAGIAVAVMNICAIVKEELTGIERETSGRIWMPKGRETELVIQKQGGNFKPGMEYKFTISLVTSDHKRIKPDSNKSFNYSAAFYGEEDIAEVRQNVAQLDDNGKKTIVVKIPEKAAGFCFQVDRRKKPLSFDSDDYSDDSYEEGVFEEAELESFESPSNSFIQLETECDNTAEIGDVVTFTITKSGDFPIKGLTLQVISKGSMLFTEGNNSSNSRVTIDVPIIHEMAPKSQIIVYAIRADNGEMLIDYAIFCVKNVLKNNVTVSINPEKTKPYNDDGKKNEATVTVNTDPGSLVGILGVDQRVILLKSGNDVTQSQIDSASEKCDIQPESYLFEGFMYGINGRDAREMIKNSGLLIFTDAYIYDNSEQRDRIPRYRQMCGMSEVKRKVDVKVRSEFPETWIWFNSVSRTDGKVEYKAQVPDTISSFIVSSFAVNPNTGLGIAPTTAKLEVFRLFFISLDLPYSIKQGEKFSLQPMIFNYGDCDQRVTVTLEHNKQSGFNIIEKATTKEEKLNQRIVQVKAKGGIETVTFIIVPIIIGHIKLLIKAIGQNVTDGIEMNLLVEPEGVRVYFNRPMALDFTKDNVGDFSSTVEMVPRPEIQKDIVKDSDRVEFSVLGDVMGSVLSGLESLIRMPYGCGEQNMITMVPNIIVIKYLEATGEANNHQLLILKAKKHLEIGYQRELSYMHKDGSFSAFGESDEKGSTWLTAYVIRSFIDAKDYIFIDPDVLSKAISWLREKQKTNGQYEEQGMIFDKEIQSGGGNPGIPMTAYVSAALIRGGHKEEKAIKYLEHNLEEHKSRPYVIAVTAYALGLANSAKFSRALDILTESAVNEGGERHWLAYSARKTTDGNWWQDGPEPLDVQTTSYALLSYLLVDRMYDALPCVQWLLARRNSLGGFTSTQDTVVGIWALSEYGRKISKGNNIKIDVIQGNKTSNFKLNDENRMVLQRETLGGLSQPVRIIGSGKGMALAQVSWCYNVRKLPDSKPFECKITVSVEPSGKVIKLTLSCRYNLKGKSNMALLEVEIPSGFKVDGHLLNGLYGKVRNLKKIETSKNDTLASVYFDTLDDDYSNIDMTLHQLFDVEDQKPSQIRVIDYYHPHKAMYMNYSIANGEWTNMDSAITNKGSTEEQRCQT